MITFMTALLPLVIIILMGTFFFMFKAGNKFMTVKITHWLLLIYVGVLLLALAVSPFITGEPLGRKSMDQAEQEQEMNDLYENINNGDIANIDHYLMKKSSFDHYQEEQLTILSNSEYGPQIFVERKDSNDAKIEAFIYVNGLIIDGYDFSDLLKPYQLELTDNTLTIIPTKQDIDISIESPGFPIRQFNGESSFLNHTFSSGEPVVYLRIPVDLELITNDQVYLEYIN